MQRDMRLKYLFEGNEEDNDENNYNKKLYIKSKWPPPKASNNVENRIENFRDAVTKRRNLISSNTTNVTNITASQLHLLKILKNDPRFIIKLMR